MAGVAFGTEAIDPDNAALAPRRAGRSGIEGNVRVCDAKDP